jgi:hypothetical protein
MVKKKIGWVIISRTEVFGKMLTWVAERGYNQGLGKPVGRQSRSKNY